MLPVLLSGFQVVPLVENTCQAKMRFAGNRPRRITCQNEGFSVGLGLCHLVRLLARWLAWRLQQIAVSLQQRYGGPSSLMPRHTSPTTGACYSTLLAAVTQASLAPGHPRHESAGARLFLQRGARR